jgi:enoyl-CoA hydratase/carnithine racemase
MPDTAAAGILADVHRGGGRILLNRPKALNALTTDMVLAIDRALASWESVVTERAVLAMPGTGIGFFPDIGASNFVPRLPGAIGMYLGLTGQRIDAADALYIGLATHFVPADLLDTVGTPWPTAPMSRWTSS